MLIKGFDGVDLKDLPRVQEALQKYSEAIGPFAENSAKRLILEMNRKNKAAWLKYASDMRRALRDEIDDTRIGEVFNALMAEQVTLIKSIPLDASQRVHRLVMEGYTNSRRVEEIRDEIERSTHVSRSRAMLIARTESTRTATTLTQARATHIGSDGYIWRTAEDEIVRPSHRAMEGKFVPWDRPPTLDNLTGHAGCLPNCFTGSTIVTDIDDLRAVTRSAYRGPIFVIVAGNTTFEATPNHPIMTRRGWVSASTLQKGDDLAQVAVKPLLPVMQKRHNKPISFDQLFESQRLVIEPELGGIFDFYGDVLESEVKVVREETNLPFYSDLFAEGIRDEMISHADIIACLRFLFRRTPQVVVSLLSCIAGDLARLFFGAHLRQQPVGLRLRPPFDAVFFEDMHDRHTGASITSCEHWRALASQVGGDDFFLRQYEGRVGMPSWNDNSAFAQVSAEIVRMRTDNMRGVFKHHSPFDKFLCVQDISVRDFAGHVYTCETKKGYYGVGDLRIAAKNCRCYPEPVIPQELLRG